MNDARNDRAPMAFIDLKRQYAALRDNINTRLQRVLDHGQYIMGPEVAELEQRLAERSGARHCISVASGSEALLIALMALELKPGDEVITTPFTFAASAEMIVLAGCTPVFVDIEAETCNIDATKIESAITPQTRAILPVSLYGQVADMDEINAIAARHGLAVIEDAAQSFGATYQGRQSTNLSTFGCTSFFPSKPLGCYGDGGAIFTSDDALAQACREIRVHGQSRRYHHSRIGVGGRMDTLQCAVVLAKLDRFDWELQRRHEFAARYHELLQGLHGLGLLTVRDDRACVWSQYTVFCDDRPALQSALHAAGVPTAIHYPMPLHHQPAYAVKGGMEQCPQSVAASARVLSLPMSADLSDAEQQAVVTAVVSALGGVRGSGGGQRAARSGS
jgi:UDP-2-acetamido-2-deoxy-ribo-hexuluronate aminotransferase